METSIKFKQEVSEMERVENPAYLAACRLEPDDIGEPIGYCEHCGEPIYYGQAHFKTVWNEREMYCENCIERETGW